MPMVTKNQEHIPSIMMQDLHTDVPDLVVDTAVDQVVVREVDMVAVDRQIDLLIVLQDLPEIVLHIVLTDQQDQQETDQHMEHHAQVMETIDQDEIVLHMVLLDHHVHKDQNVDHMIDSFD